MIFPNRKVSSFIVTQLPENVSDNYPVFTEFIKTYFKWLEQTGNPLDIIFNLINYSDVDKTTDELLTYYKNEYLVNFPDSQVSEAFLIKHIREFYQEKGSEFSYKFLFKVFFGKNVDFYYPTKDILRVSDSKWIVKSIIRTTTNNNTFLLLGMKIIGLTSKATAIVDNVITLRINGQQISELTLVNIQGNFIPNEIIESGNIQESIYPIVTGVNIVLPGMRYSKGQQIDIIDSMGPGYGAKAVISEISGYSSMFIQSTSSTTVIFDSNNLSPFNDAYEGMVLRIPNQPEQKITAYSGFFKTATIYPGLSNYTDPINTFALLVQGSIAAVKIVDFGLNYANDTTFTVQGGNEAGQLTGTIGAVANYPGYWENQNNQLSGSSRLQDSYFYQVFSYVLRSALSSDYYESLVQKLVHPSGTKMFGEVFTEDYENLGPSFKTLEYIKLFFQTQNSPVQDLFNITIDDLIENENQMINIAPDSSITIILPPPPPG